MDQFSHHGDTGAEHLVPSGQGLFGAGESELAVAEFYHAGMLTGYEEFMKRISMDLMGPIYADKTEKKGRLSLALGSVRRMIG